MAWSDPIDIYCERSDPSFWAEPINALSNLGFLVAAWLAWRNSRTDETRDYPVLGLIGLVALVGIGSFLFHTFATRAFSLVDVIPITAFVLSYLFLALRRFLGVSTLVALTLLGGFFGLSETLSFPALTARLNGSDAYLPPLAALVAIAIFAPDPTLRRSLLWSAAIFAVSLGFRTIDVVCCKVWPLGTHFVWHLINAVLLYRLVAIAADATSIAARRERVSRQASPHDF